MQQPSCLYWRTLRSLPFQTHESERISSHKQIRKPDGEKALGSITVLLAVLPLFSSYCAAVCGVGAVMAAHWLPSPSQIHSVFFPCAIPIAYNYLPIQCKI